MASERIQKLLARAGYGSRRACEEIIEAGRVTVDGQIAHLGDQADPETQRILVDGVPMARPQPHVYIIVHKPRGYVTTTRDPQGRKTVLDLVELPGARKRQPLRLYPVGRLDIDSEGLLLLTNDGDLTQRLTHPRYEHPRIYRVLIEGEPDAEALDRWRRGVTLDGRLSRFDRIVVEERSHGKTWLRVTVHEGRKHLVKRIVAALGYPSQRLVRVTMGPLQLGTLALGKWRHLTQDEVSALRREVKGTPRPQRRGSRGEGRSGDKRGSGRGTRPTSGAPRRDSGDSTPSGANPRSRRGPGRTRS